MDEPLSVLFADSPPRGPSPDLDWAGPWYRLWRGRLTAFACRILGEHLGEPVEAEDALHTVFVRLLTMPSLPLDFGVPYLFRSVRNECLQRIRNMESRALALATLSIGSDVQPSPEERISQREELARVFEVVTERQREILVLRALGYSYDEIAQLCDISMNTVDALVQNGRTACRKERERERERERKKRKTDNEGKNEGSLSL